MEVQAPESTQSPFAATLVETPASLRPPVRWREIVSVALAVALCDLALYRGHGFAGYALLFLAAPLLLCLGATRLHAGRAPWIVGALLVALAARCLWQGAAPLALIGFFLILALARSLAGGAPHILETFAFARRVAFAGCEGLGHYARSLSGAGEALRRAPWLNVLLPLAAILAFGTIFVFANPDLLSLVFRRLESVLKSVGDWLARFSPIEVVFWGMVAWITVGLLRPMLRPDTEAEPQPIVKNCDDPLIREGVGAILAQRLERAEALDRRRRSLGWTAWQGADSMLLDRLQAKRQRWADYQTDVQGRNAALKRFHTYAYQWY